MSGNGNLGTGFAQTGFSPESNISPFNQYFSNAVISILNRLGIVYPSGTGGSGGGTGSVTSVGLADGSVTPIYLVTNTPITTSGTLTFALNTESRNLVFAGPASGANAQPTFRVLVNADLPGGTAAGTGSVTAVSAEDNSTFPIFGWSNIPITTSGTMTMTLITQPKNEFLAGPVSGANAQPTFRLIANGDIPHFIDFAYDQVFYSMAGGF